MFIKLEVENFRSIKTKIEFHTVAKKSLKRFSEHIYRHGNDFGLLKTINLYGGNGAGKTNIFKALYLVKKLVTNSNYLTSEGCLEFFFPFRLDEVFITKDSIFRVDFIINEVIYIYVLKVNSSKRKIIFEGLSKYVDNEEILILKREEVNDDEDSIKFPLHPQEEAFVSVLQDFLRPHSTILSILGERMNKGLTEIVDVIHWFNEKLKFQFPTYEFPEITHILNSKKEYLTLANKIIKHAKLGIDRLDIKQFPISTFFGEKEKDQIRLIESRLEFKDFYTFSPKNGVYCTAFKDINKETVVLELKYIHKSLQGNEVEFDMNQESNGTQIFIQLIPALILSYGEGISYFIDDMSISLHPILLKEIIEQYLKNNIEFANGQFIFNSHEDFLLDESTFRQDEIWLSEKNKNGETDLFSLSDFSNVRFDLDWRKGYLNGMFGGVPFKQEPKKLDFAS